MVKQVYGMYDAVIQALKQIYRAESAKLAGKHLEELAASEWGQWIIHPLTLL